MEEMSFKDFSIFMLGGHLVQRSGAIKKLLKFYPKYDARKIADICTGDETWVHYFKPHRKVNNKKWTTKHTRRPCIAKRSQRRA